jgi:MoaA/NifB/PqqE/SkfB family radical SAM enzyme
MLQKLIPVITFPAQNLKGKYCLSPFVQINIDTDGHVGICGCATWQPTRIGNIFEHSLTDLLSGTMAQRIRQSIIDGTYTYCDPDKCGILKTNGLNTAETLSSQVAWAVEDSVRFLVPHHITLSMDRTCNLWCPSCRHAVLKNNYKTKEQQTQLSALVARNLFGTPTDQRIVLTLDTGGDLFASAFMLDFLANIPSKDFPNLEIDILSNGLLCEDRWHRMGDMQDHVKKITVSYDAAEAKTYEKLRRGGAWSNIMQAMRWLQGKKAQNGMQFNARMVVQRANYKEMQDFYDLSKSFGCDSVQFQRIVNWGTFTRDQFAQIDVYHKDSDLYADAMAQLELVSGLPDTEFWHGMPKIS